MCRESTIAMVLMPALAVIGATLMYLGHRARKDWPNSFSYDLWMRPSQWERLLGPEGARWWRRYNAWGSIMILTLLVVAVSWFIYCVLAN